MRRKKLLALVLGATMTMSLLAGCSKDAGTNNETTTAKQEETTTVAQQEETTAAPAPSFELAAPEALPEKAFAHITFDGDDEGYFAVAQTDNPGKNDGATYGIEPTDVTFGYADGPVDKCLYVDGKFGVDLNLEPTNTDAYTVSFWVNADRLSTFGPTLQMGYNMGMAADAGNDVTWFNVTQSEWGEASAKIFPIVWSRNEASDSADGSVDCWPWMYAFDNEIHGKREWVMVTIVCTGEVQNGATGATTAGAQFYVDGVKMYDSQANYTSNAYFEYTWDATLAPNIMKPGDKEFESLFGINYWDTVFKGFVDDLYVYDTALTPGQVASLYALGNPAVESVAPEGVEVEVETEPAAVNVTPTGTEVVGATDCSTGWWSAFSKTVAVPAGETASVDFINWHAGDASNWNNFLVVLQNVADAHSATDNAAYAEYAVLRADNYGWLGDKNTGANLAELGWTVESDWNWDTFLADTQGANVHLEVTNNGTTADVVATVTSATGAVHTQKYAGIAVSGDLYFCLTAEKACLDIGGSAPFSGVVTPVGSAQVGPLDCTAGWWTAFSDTVAVAAGETSKIEFTNWHTTEEPSNWNNFLVVLQNVPDAHTADTAMENSNADYAEYAVLRADNYGWLADKNTGANLAELGWTVESDWNWDTYLDDMQGANVVVEVTNNGTTADVVATVTTTAGKVYTQKYAGIAVSGDLYYCLTAEKACLDIK